MTRWPTYEGMPQLFLLAIRLSELRPFDQDGVLPAEGWLNFFVAPEVFEGRGSPDACAVIHSPDEVAPCMQPPMEGLCFEWEGLTFGQGVHSVLQGYEFGREDEYDAAFAEFEALGFDVLPAEVEALQEADYLLGKQLYSTAAGIESTHDLSAFIQEQQGYADASLRALLTLRRDTGAWSFFQDNSLMSLTFFVELDDLHAHRFGRVIVDTTAD